MTKESVIELLEKNIEKAQKLEYVRQPLAWALYQTWKEVDEKTKPIPHIKDGIYVYTHKYGHGEIVLDVKETEKSFIFKLIKNTIKYDAPHIDDMFKDSNKVTIKKNGSNHALSIWSDGKSFTLYPYRVGVPYTFNLCEEKNK